jgi:hypothetical protein
MRRLVSGSIVALGLLLVGSRGVRAQSCPAGCAQQLKACAQAGRVGKLGCRTTCRQNPADVRGCLRACIGDFLALKQSCGGDFRSCLGTCTPPPPQGPPPTLPPPSPCRESCRQALAACARGVVVDSRTCLTGCRTATNKLACVIQCGRDAGAGGRACASTFRSCVTGCGGGSPSGAFLDEGGPRP